MTADTRGGDLTARRARLLVLEIVRRYFGETPRRLAQRGGGLTNMVFEFRVRDGDFVVRLHSRAGQINGYLKEQWAMVQARRVGVPTPEVMEVDNEAVGLPYMVSRKVDGIDAAHHPRRVELLGELGALAARLHGVRTQGFGNNFDWSSNQLSRNANWGDYLADELCVDERLATLARHRMLKPAQTQALLGAIDTMRRWRRAPVLHHGDLRLKNLIVAPDSGRVRALIDWDNCRSAPAPHWDLSVALHDLNVDQKESFLRGYGISPANYAEALPFMRAINTLNYAPVIEGLAQRKDQARLAWYRVRLHGLFDLYP